MAELERTLSFPVLLVITINSIMGTGIFFLPALGAKEAGVASIISWVAMAAVAMAVGLVFAELVAMFPTSGGVYEYTKQAFGTFWSFIFGWMTLVAGNVTIAMLVVGAVRYLNPSLPEVVKIVVSIGFVLLFNAMAYRGMRTSAFMLVTFGFITLGTLCALIIPGIMGFKSSLLTPLMTHPPSKVFFTVFLIAETFFGWETATFLAEETKNPEKAMPRALWISTLFIGLLSILFVTVSLANIPWSDFGASLTPLADLGALFYGAEAVPIISMLVYLSIIGSVAGWIVSAPRLVMSLAKDKLFVHQLAQIHERYNTPYKAIIFQTLVTSLLIIVGSANYEMLLELLVPLVLLMYGGVVVSFLILRFTRAKTVRPFRVPGGVALGGLVIIVIGALLGTWLHESHGAIHMLKLLGSFIFAGVPLYLLLTVYYNPDAIIRLNSFFALGSLWLENLFLPKRVRRHILALFEDLEGRHVLDYGAGVGTLTLLLADRVGLKGRVTATDISKRNVAILERRLERRGVGHVRVIHDPHQVNRVHPEVQEVDIAFSVGMLSYIQDLRKVLRELGRVLPQRGKVCFVEYTDFFRILPNPKWIDDKEQLERVFRERGFLVRIFTLRGLLWNYLVIYGEKRAAGESRVPFV